MVLYNHHLIRFNYAPTQDMLYVEQMQDLRKLPVPEIKKVFFSIVACVREHQIKRLLLNFNRNTVDLTAAEYKAVMAQLAVGLRPTSIQKVALIATKDTARENKVESVYREIQAAVKLPLEFRSFTKKVEALHWLMA